MQREGCVRQMTIKEWWGARPHGGVHAPHRKNTAECETIVMPPPERILLAMSQHLGAPCEPVVQVVFRPV